MHDGPEINYATCEDGAHIAYQVFGDGPIDLVMVPGFVSHLEQFWESPQFARLNRQLGSFARVITFDKRGTGLSDQTAQLPDIDRRMLDLCAVIDAVGSERPSIFGISEGGAMSILYAATYPERVRSLVLYGAFAMPLRTDDHPVGVPAEDLRKTRELFGQRWGSGVGLGAWARHLPATKKHGGGGHASSDCRRALARRSTCSRRTTSSTCDPHCRWCGHQRSCSTEPTIGSWMCDSAERSLRALQTHA